MKRDNLINKKVSIIVPVYNVEGYIEECLSSLCEQTYTNIEIIVVDDGSTDRSGNICDMYSQKDQRIVVYHKENGGLSSARNYGLLYIKGEYVTFIDSDDYLNSNAIEIMLSNLINNEADVVECCFVDKKSKLKDKVITWNNVEAMNKYISSEYLYPNVSVCNKLYNRKIIEDLTFPVGKIHEDYLFQCMVFSRLSKYVFINEELYHYRYREDSITHRKFNAKDIDKLEIYKARTDFLIKKGYLEAAVISKREELIILFSLYWKLCNYDLPQKVEIGEEIRNRKIEVLKSGLVWKRKLIYLTYYINPKIYLYLRNIIG